LGGEVERQLNAPSRQVVRRQECAAFFDERALKVGGALDRHSVDGIIKILAATTMTLWGGVRTDLDDDDERHNHERL